MIEEGGSTDLSEVAFEPNVKNFFSFKFFGFIFFESYFFLPLLDF